MLPEVGSVGVDRVAGVLELVLILTGLSLLLGALIRSGIGRWRYLLLLAITLLVGPFVLLVALASRYLSRRPDAWKLGIAVTVVTALTVAQPFGVEAESLGDDVPAAVAGAEGRSPTETETMDIAGLPVLRFTAYRRKESDVLSGLGECCPATHDLRLRSWVPPFLFTHAERVAGLCGDNPCWGPRDTRLTLHEVSGQWYALLVDPSKSTRVWKLSAGVASGWGLWYWLLSAAAIALLLWRRRAERSRAASGGGPQLQAD